jgi:hypothetical protein
MRKPPKTDPQANKRCDCGDRKNVHANGRKVDRDGKTVTAFGVGACQVAGCECKEFHVQLAFSGMGRGSSGAVKKSMNGPGDSPVPFRSWAQKMKNGGKAQ